MFAKYIYPRIEIGAAHARPIRPFCFTQLVDQCLTFNIYSSNDSDRVEFWTVDDSQDCSLVGQLYTQEEMELELFGMPKAQYIAENPGP